MGADDYIAKPFNSRVVVARVKRCSGVSGALGAEGASGSTGLLFNGWRLDICCHELFNFQQQAVPLTREVQPAGAGAKPPTGCLNRGSCWPGTIAKAPKSLTGRLTC